RYRWVDESNLPLGVQKDLVKSRDGRKTVFEFDFALEKREMTGPYGKPREYWDAFDKAIKDGTARRTEKETKSKKTFPGHEMTIGTTQYQVSNPDIFDQVNTILKMSKKRALVDAALSAGRLSDLFTQDLDDFAEYEPAQAEPAPKHETARASAKPTAPDFPADAPAHTEQDADQLATPDQLDSISKHADSLKGLGKTENQIWDEIYRKGRERGGEFAELQEMTFAQADYVSNYLGGWIEHIKAERAKKNGAKK
ncbi:MAG: hypothetical protein WC329_07685, partial [Candidatus Omnitrophota bacterium]